MVTCRCCGETADILTHSEVSAVSPQASNQNPLWDWYKCRYCHSETSTQGDPDPTEAYSSDYPMNRLALIDFDRMVEEYNVNMDYFDDEFENPEGVSIIEVGSCEQAGIQAMLRRGYRACGWDLMNFADAQYPHLVRVSPAFDPQEWDEKFDAVMSRETVEHVPDPRKLISDMAEILKSGGVMQVQTPRPGSEREVVAYQHDHLVILSPGALIEMLESVGLAVERAKYWSEGQLIMARKS